MNKPTLFLLFASAPLVVSAQDDAKYQCSYGDLERRVEIVYETGVAVPCEVHYYKDTEAPGERQVLWSATSQSGYCETKTREFVSQLEEWGWDCGSNGGEVEAEADTDDTDALAPAQDDNQQ